MNPFCHIEIPVTDLARAKEFYEILFGWQVKILPGNHYALFSGGGFRRVKEIKSGGITPFLQVNDLTSYRKRVEKLGGKILVEQETAGDYGYCTFFQDPDGNVLGLYEEMKSK